MEFFQTIIASIPYFDIIFNIIIVLGGIYNYLIYRRIASICSLVMNELKGAENPLAKELDDFLPASNNQSSKEKIDKLLENKKRSEELYSTYIAITSLFPFAGILGTILALIKNIGYDPNHIMDNFSFALSSTVIGIGCAMIHKFLEGKLSHQIEYNKELWQSKQRRFLTEEKSRCIR